MSNFSVGGYAMFDGHEVKIAGRLGDSGVYRVEWMDRWDGYKWVHAKEDELSPVPDVDTEKVQAKFEVVYDPLNKRYDIAIPLPSNRIVRKPIESGRITISQQQTTLDMKRKEDAKSQLKDLIAYYQGLLAYVESKKDA